MTNKSLEYRPEIDGLRSIAVLSVILYHYSVPGFSGGFVGVDVFFVISGFLIGGILWAEYQEKQTISLANFYTRRLRRLAPAFLVMAAATFIVGCLLLLPVDLRSLGKEIIAATIYIANIIFYRSSGYFDTASEEKPLLHTWSLSLEEQFYLFLPLFIIIFAKSRRAMLFGLISGALISLGLSAFLTSRHHTAAFYLFPFRAWELLAGVLLAIYGSQREKRRSFGPWMSWLGLTLISVAVVFFKASTAFPGILGAVPVAGTILLILNGRDANLVNRAMTTRIPVTIGLASYSLYLWHWPVLVISLAWRQEYAGPGEVLLWIALALLLGMASWRLVEMPTRNRQTISTPAMLAIAIVGNALLLVAGGAAYLTDGLRSRWSGDVLAHSDASEDFLQDWSRCHTPSDGPFADMTVCPIGPSVGEPHFLVWGDSHVRALKEGLDLAAHEAGQAGLIIWRAGCPPLFGIRKQESAATRQQDDECTEELERMSRALADLPHVDRILLVGRWSYYADGHGVGADAHNTISLSPSPGHELFAEGDPRNPKDQAALFAAAADGTIQRLRQLEKKVFVLRQNPEVPSYNSRRTARLVAHGHIADGAALAQLTEVSRQDAETRERNGSAPFARAAAAGTVTVIDYWDALCGATTCSAMRDGRSLYFDNNHLTNHGARVVRHSFDSLFKPVDSADANARPDVPAHE